MSQVSYGTITITDTNDIESIAIEYNKNQSNQNPPSEGDSNWSTNRPTWQQGYYIWQRTRIHKSGTATTADIIGTPVCVTGSTGEQGQPGQQGQPGAAGRSLTGVETKYCIYSTGTPSDSYSGWQDTIPEYNSSTPNYWVKVTNTYSEAPTTEVVKYKDTGITNAMAKAADAQSRAATAETNASNALSLSQATQQHFWFNSVKTGNIEAGAYITDVVIDSFKPNKSGNYLLAGSNGIELGNGTHPYMQLTASELNFFHPNSNNIDAQLSSNGLIVKSGGIEAGTVGQNGGIYLSTKNYGTTHNNQTITINDHEATNWRQIIGTKFGVDSDGVLYAGGANIQGKITVTSGSNVYTTDDVNPLDIGGRNLIISFTTIIGSILGSSGELIDNPRGVVSDLIEIQPNEKYILQYWLPNNLTDTGTDRAWNCKICWYSQEETASEETTRETYISGYTAEYFSDYKVYFGVAPTNAKYCRVCFELPASYQDGEVSQEWINGDDGYRWKLEQGTIATDWTLAPEDTNNIAEQQDLYLLTDSEYNYENVNYNYVTEQNGDIISIDDAVLEYPTESLIVDVEPIQNLNGYDKPWVGGAGKNKLPSHAVGTVTTNGLTITYYADGSLKINGTATASTDVGVWNSGNVAKGIQGSFKLNGCTNGAGSKYQLIARVRDTSASTNRYIPLNNGDVEVSTSSTEVINSVYINVKSGIVMNDVWFYPMLRLSTVSDATFEPYENICPISGRTEVVTQRTGKNLLHIAPQTLVDRGITWTVNADGTVTATGTLTATNSAVYINVTVPTGSYKFNGSGTGSASSTYYAQVVDGSNWYNPDYGNRDVNVTISSTNVRVCFAMKTNPPSGGITFKPMLRLSSETDATFEPYNGNTYTTALGRTVYGGTLDVVSGVLTVDRVSVTFNGSENWETINQGLRYYGNFGGKAYSTKDVSNMLTYATSDPTRNPNSYTFTVASFVNVGVPYTVAEWKSLLATTNLQVVYELATPQTYQLTPQQVELLADTNSIWSDGEITIKYITAKLAEWSPTYQTPDQYNPYVWWKYILTYSSGQSYESNPVIFNSNPQEQLSNFQNTLNQQNENISTLKSSYTEIADGQIKLTNNLTNITAELESYRRGIELRAEIPRVKVYARKEYMENGEQKQEESSVNVYSNIIEIKGNGNTVTEVDSESLKAETIYSTTLLPRVREIVPGYSLTQDVEIKPSKTYYTKNGDVYTEVASPEASSLTNYYEFNQTVLYGKLAFIARKNGHFSIKVMNN